jgi:hypothetical protein
MNPFLLKIGPIAIARKRGIHVCGWMRVFGRVWVRL